MSSVGRAYGRFVFWEGASLWFLGTRPGEGPYPKTALHSHHAVQVTISLRGWVSIENRDGTITGEVLAVAPDTDHALAGEGLVAHLFIDPEGRPGRAVQRAFFSGSSIVSIPVARLAGLPTQLLAGFEADNRDNGSLLELGRALLAQLALDATDSTGSTSRDRDERPEARVRKMVAWASERLQASVTLADVAAHVGLSTGRARHLFVEHTGLPFRTYLLWLRLMRAVELFSAGTSLTEAAHSAGFSDSSHLSRTFRRMFGITADSLRIV